MNIIAKLHAERESALRAGTGRRWLYANLRRNADAQRGIARDNHLREQVRRMNGESIV